jgi:hypothetical protein
LRVMLECILETEYGAVEDSEVRLR